MAICDDERTVEFKKLFENLFFIVIIFRLPSCLLLWRFFCFLRFGSTEIPKIQQKVAKICVNDWLIEQLYDTSSG